MENYEGKAKKADKSRAKDADDAENESGEK